MLKVSSRGHYGLRLMTQLAGAHGQGPVSLTEVARVEGLPLPYLEQLVVPLRRSGLVEGTRGLHGGYRLTRDPAEMTVGSILRALEGPVSLVECTSDEYVGGTCEREGSCLSQSIWMRIKLAVDSVLESTSLADLLSDPTFGLPARLSQLDSLELLPQVTV